MKATKVRFGSNGIILEKICARLEWLEIDTLEEIVRQAARSDVVGAAEILDDLRGLQQAMIEEQLDNARLAEHIRLAAKE